MIRGNDRLVATPDDVARALRALASCDAVSLPALAEPFRRTLLDAARAQPYRPARAAVGGGDRVVLQDMEVSDAFPEDSPFHDLRREFQALLERAAGRLDADPFAEPLALDDMMLQRYRPGPIGITPHKDHVDYVNLACLFTLTGEARFAVCADRRGNGARDVDAAPGRAILMRAPGFAGSRARPFHFVADIASPRYSVGLRQRRAGAR